jgi:pimeloyl-ACP methyl ester carboxylesterase
MTTAPSTTDPVNCQTAPQLFARTLGTTGPTVLCLHSSTGSQGQWRGLSAALAGLARVITPDLHGHGRSPAWPAEQAPSLRIDATAAARLLPAEGGVHLVAHSYGAAVAMQVALDHPERVRSLALYEPVAFGVLVAMAPPGPALSEITAIANQVARLSAQGQLAEAAEAFVCYWGGPDAWARMSEAQRESVAGRIGTIPLHFEALFGAAWTADRLSALRMPVLLMNGSRTRASARQVAELLGTTLPHARRLEVPGAGHLGPMTHEVVVNEALIGHLQACGALRAPTAEPALT